MNAKKHKQISLWWIAAAVASMVSIIALGVVVGRWRPETIAEADSSVYPPVPSVQIANLNDPTDKTGVDASITEPVISAQVVNGIEVTASNPRLQGDKFTVDVCFTIPDDNPDWIITKASLTTDKAISSDWWATPIELRFPSANGQQQVITHDAKGIPSVRTETVTGSQQGRRCDALTFQVPAGSTVSTATLSINAITSRPAEGQYCEKLAKVQDQLKARNVNITINCAEKDGVTNVTITNKPSSMSQADAEGLVFSDEWYSKFGPWEFELAISK